MPALVTKCNKWNETFFVTFKSEEDNTAHMPIFKTQKAYNEFAIAASCFGRKGKEVFNIQFHLCYWKGSLPWTSFS